MNGGPRDADAVAVRQASDSLIVASWTLVSRISGVVRIAVVAAVLGPTVLGSAFLAIDALPMIVLQLFAGALITSLLIPALVPSIDAGDLRAAEQIAGGFLGCMLALTVAAAVATIAAGDLVARLLTIGVTDRAVADQANVVRTLIVMVMWQLPLYALAITGGAVMNARGRFALAGAAPVAENLAVIAVLGSVAALYGTGPGLLDRGDAPLVLLGLGTTAAVGVHAALMVWGAWRTGVRLVPRAGWRDSRVRQVLRRMTASLAATATQATRLFAMIVVANTVPGGVVALRVAVNFLYLPIQVGARPVALTMLSDLTRLTRDGRLLEFRDQCSAGLARVGFLALPATAAYLALAGPIAEAVSYGEMAGTVGVTLVAACIAGLAVAVSAESAFLLLSHASYARGDADAPLVSAAIGTLASFALLPLAVALEGRETMLALGLTFSAGSAMSAWHLRRRINAHLPPGRNPAGRSLVRTLVASALMVIPALGMAQLLSTGAEGTWVSVLVVAAASVAGAAAFVLVQVLWRSPELAFFARGRWARGAAPPGSETGLGPGPGG